MTKTTTDKEQDDRPLVIVKHEDGIYSWATPDHGWMNHSRKSYVEDYMKRNNFRYEIKDKRKTILSE